jgi:hypothetical protein
MKMKTSVFSILSLAVFCLCLNVSCSENSRSSQPGAAGNQTNPPTAGGSYVDGTTDGNGGNGVDGRMYESYIVDPTELPAFKNVILDQLKIFEAILPRSGPDAYTDEDILRQREKAKLLFLGKTWYIAPISLKSLNKKSIGVEFSQENTEQLAIQTEQEVWINAEAFNKMTEKDQATLIVHELTMTFYLNAQKGNRDFCKMFGAPDSNCADIPDNKPRKEKLDQTDYQKIRAATNFFMSITKDTKYSDITALSASFRPLTEEEQEANDFNTESATKDWEKQKVQPFVVITALKAATVAKQLDGPCTVGGTKKQCSFEVSQTDGNSLTITITDANSKEVLGNATIPIGKDPIYFEKLKRKSAPSTKYFSFSIRSGLPTDETSETYSVDVLVSDWENAPSNTSNVVGLALNKTIWTTTKSVRSSDNQPCRDMMGITTRENQILLGISSTFKVLVNKSGSNSCD